MPVYRGVRTHYLSVLTIFINANGGKMLTGLHIRLALAAFEMTYEDLGKELDIDPVTLRSFAYDRRGINSQTVEKMGKYFKGRGVVFLDDGQVTMTGGRGIRFRDEAPVTNE